MANPWTKKNPILSVLLSGTNAWAGAARGAWAGAAKRQRSAALDEGIRQAAGFWTSALAPARRGRKPRKHG